MSEPTASGPIGGALVGYPTSLGELKLVLGLEFGENSIQIPKTWLLSVSKSDLDYLADVSVDPLHYLYDAAIQFAGLKLRGDRIAEIIRLHVGPSDRTRFAWLYLIALRQFVFWTGVREYTRKPSEVVDRKLLREVVTFIDAAHRTADSSGDSPLGDVSVVMRKYPHLHSELEKVMHRWDLLHRMDQVLRSMAPKQRRQYPKGAISAIHRMDQLLKPKVRARRRRAHYLHVLFSEAGVTLGDPENPNPEEPLRVNLQKWEKALKV